LTHIVDYLYPDLDAYEAALYTYLFRKTLFENEPKIRLGKRTIATKFVRGSRGGGLGNAGGRRVSYGHIDRALKGLERKGCIKVGDTTRAGTLYTVVHPGEIPLVSQKISAEVDAFFKEAAPLDYYADPLLRRELFERDQWRCQYCGEGLTPGTASLDHYLPQSKGGANTKENLRTSCLICNSIKSGRMFEEVAPLLLQSVAARRVRSE
jgi:hypothetical protein